MTGVKEFEAPDLEAVLHVAAEDLGIELGRLDYEVLDEGAKGFLGVGSRPVRIRVRVPEPVPEGRSGRIEEEVLALQERIVGRMGLDLSLRVESSEECIEISMTGRDRDLVLQDRAELLDAFQYLLNRIFGKRLNDRRVVVDCDGFRKRKKEELRLIAKKVSEKVKLTGVKQELGLMNPYERRIVHLAVAEEDGVSSESSGEGFRKRVTIYPNR